MLTPTDSTASANYEAIVVGAGFSGVYALHQLRKQGLSVRVFEAGDDLGGVWHWNRYPGARVDSETPFYQLNIPEVYRTWNFSQRFPDHKELREYFHHCDKVLNLRKDVEFDSRVEDVSYDVQAGRWTVKTATGTTATCKYLILATGLLHRRNYPDFPGLSEYQGVVHHSGFWPEDLSMKGKKVAIIGAGATSVQIVQELSKEADQLTMFMRRPSYCLPMRQRKFTVEEQTGWKAYYPALFEAGRHSGAGFPGRSPQCGIFDVSPEEREAYFEELWGRGAFNYQTQNYNNVITDKAASTVVYDFWKKKTRARMTNPAKQKLMAPDVAPYYFGTKRNPLENDYYESLDRENVEIVNLKKSPLKTFTSTGMIMENGTKYDFDAVILATGFDSFTGSLTHMGLKNKNDVDIKDLWQDGVKTYLGMMISGFPNTFIVYSPQSPTALSNGPTILECQIDFAVETIAKLEKEKAKSIEPKPSAAAEWKKHIDMMNEHTLFPLTSSWWTGGNIPGKKAENMTYVGGIDMYEKECREKLQDWEGFNIVYEKRDGGKSETAEKVEMADKRPTWAAVDVGHVENTA